MALRRRRQRRFLALHPYANRGYLTSELYPDSISVDGHAGPNQVVFEPFVGIAPRVYMQLFEESDRKGKDGNLRPWNAPKAKPRLIEFPESHMARLVIEGTEFAKFKQGAGSLLREEMRDG